MTLLARVLHHNSDKSQKSASKSSPSIASSSSKASVTKRRPLTERISLGIELESPPIVLYGHAHESTGSIISGVLTLDVLASRPAPGSSGLEPQVTRNSLLPSVSTDSKCVLQPQTSTNSLRPEISQASQSSLGSSTSSDNLSGLSPVVSHDGLVDVESVVLSLIQTVHYTKPFMVASHSIHSCKKCATRKTTLAQWDVLSQNAAFPVGSHAYPFSHLLPGSLAASAKLGSIHSFSFIKYDLVAVARVAGRETTVVLPLNISRSILRGPDRNSMRVFPPTEVTASAVLPGVMYPKSKFPIELRMSHIVSSKGGRRWRMRKLQWKLEEHTQIAPFACEQHSSKLKDIEEAQRRAQHYKSLRTGSSPHTSSPGVNGNDNASKSTGLHHSTIQTSMFVSRPPANPQSGVPNAPSVVNTAPETVTGNQDIVEPAEEAPTNRVSDEAVHFEEDFGAVAGNGTRASDGTSPSVHASTRTSTRSTPQGQTNSPDQSAVSDSEEDGEQLFVDERRVVAHGEIKSGWKSDFSGDGSIELVAEISALNCSSGMKNHTNRASSHHRAPDEMQEGLRNDANISCDINDPILGIYVGHVLVIEVIIAEELAQSVPRPSGGGREESTSVSSSSFSTTSAPKTVAGVPTGAARVLRMQFKVVMTERSGLGIAWDDEVPPTYEDVRTLSPPTYESSAPGTPNSTQTLPSALQGVRETPSVLYGLGDTPVIGSFVQNRAVRSIDEVADLDESIQELRL